MSGFPFDLRPALDENGAPIVGPNFLPQLWSTDPGRAAITGDPADFEAFDVPQLRGIANTAPYFHDGRAKTVEEAATLMMKGGIANPHRDEKLKAWPVTPEQQQLPLAFLRSLSPELRPYERPQIP